jgi:hypothetical protein
MSRTKYRQGTSARGKSGSRGRPIDGFHAARCMLRSHRPKQQTVRGVAPKMWKFRESGQFRLQYYYLLLPRHLSRVRCRVAEPARPGRAAGLVSAWAAGRYIRPDRGMGRRVWSEGRSRLPTNDARPPRGDRPAFKGWSPWALRQAPCLLPPSSSVPGGSVGYATAPGGRPGTAPVPGLGH